MPAFKQRVRGISLPFALVALLLLGACEESRESIKSGSTATTTSQPERQFDRLWNDVARYLGGFEPLEGSVINEYDRHNSADRHRSFFTTTWPRLEKEQFEPMRIWADEQLALEQSSQRLLFYPFSGADFLNANLLFSPAEEYILFGMEPPGSAPDPRRIGLSASSRSLANIQTSLSSILNYSFFRTLAMEKDFVRTEMDGTIPVILVFIARTGHEVLDVRNVSLGNDAKVYEIANHDEDAGRYPDRSHLEDEIPGIQVLFRLDGDSTIRKLTYFSLDISNPGMAQRGFFYDYLRSFPEVTTYLKAASYLMYRDTFTVIRDFILEKSDTIVQDDSGMPLANFSRDRWDLNFYGTYTTPIPLFQKRYQSDLREAYRLGEGVQELPFGTGYKFRKGSSNLMVARKRN